MILIRYLLMNGMKNIVEVFPILRSSEEGCLFDSSVVSKPQPGMEGPIDKQSMQEAASGAAWPYREPPIPMIHADCPSFGPKSGLAHSRWVMSLFGEDTSFL